MRPGVLVVFGIDLFQQQLGLTGVEKAGAGVDHQRREAEDVFVEGLGAQHVGGKDPHRFDRSQRHLFSFGFGDGGMMQPCRAAVD